MYFVTFIVISVSSLCYLQTTEASCNRTLLPTKLVTTTTTTTTDGITINDSPITHSTNDIAANLNYDSRNDSKQFDNSNHRLETEAQEYSPHELNSLRLEFNKYKILSHLGITTNPDLLEPNLSAEYRHRLLSSEAVQKLRSAANISRQRRSLGCNQIKSDKDACCLESFYVNFTDVGWDKWILYPAGYNANYCRGQCDLSHARYYHSTLLSKFSNLIGLCCSPRQMAPLSLLYIDQDNKVHQKSMPDMIVESCDCA